MDPDDMYLYPRCGVDGTVAGLVRMMRPHVIVLDPDSGEHRTVGPTADTDKRHGKIELIKGVDGLLYVRSHAGDFRIRGMDAAPVDGIPEPMPVRTLPGGVKYRFRDSAVFENRELELKQLSGETTVFHLDWEGDGTRLFLCHAGPDDKVYGSSMLPEHLFSYDPATGASVDHGACSVSGGEAYSMATWDNKLYVASYPAARLSVYDPDLPYCFGTAPDSNPRDIGRLDDVGYRPRSMVAGPAGKVWIASVPDYGMWGGTLAWYDPVTGERGSHRHVVPDCSGFALAYLESENLLLVGFATDTVGDDVAFHVRERHRDGQVTLFVPGSTGGLTTMEYEPNLVRDIKDMYEGLAPKDGEYLHHRTWGDFNGNSHVRASLLGPSLTVPFKDGRLTLGTWQQIVVIDHDNRPRSRKIFVQVIGE